MIFDLTDCGGGRSIGITVLSGGLLDDVEGEAAATGIFDGATDATGAATGGGGCIC